MKVHLTFVLGVFLFIGFLASSCQKEEINTSDLLQVEHTAISSETKVLDYQELSSVARQPNSSYFCSHPYAETNLGNKYSPDVHLSRTYTDLTIIDTSLGVTLTNLALTSRAESSPEVRYTRALI